MVVCDGVASYIDKLWVNTMTRDLTIYMESGRSVEIVDANITKQELINKIDEEEWANLKGRNDSYALPTAKIDVVREVVHEEEESTEDEDFSLADRFMRGIQAWLDKKSQEPIW
jgi:hypothetical protein